MALNFNIKTFIIHKIILEFLIKLGKILYYLTKNTNTSHISSELNYSYYLGVFYNKNINLYSKSKIASKLLIKLK